METNDESGSLSDVEHAERAARAAVMPWWYWSLYIAAMSAMFASFFGGRDTGRWIWFGCGAVVFVALSLWERNRGVRPRPATPSTGRGVTGLVMICILFGAGWLLKHVLPPGAVTTYAVQFLAAATVVTVGVIVMQRWFPVRPRP